MILIVAALPSPPTHLRMPEGWELLYTGACMVALFAMSANALRIFLRRRDVLPVLLIASGAICVLLEPLVDVLGLCWYPEGSQFEIFELMGRPIPLLVLPGYIFFMGGLTVIALDELDRRGARGLRKVYPLMIVLEMPFEWLAVQTGVYVYYGQQPLEVWDFPVWWLFVNTMVPVVTALVIHHGRWAFRGARVLLVLPLLPAIDAGVNAAFSWPTWTVLNSDVPMAVTQAAGLVTVGLCLAALWALTDLSDTADATPALDSHDASIGIGATVEAMA